jgi:hypothetical protein
MVEDFGRTPQLVELDQIGWQTYEKLLRATAAQHVRITYDEGRMVLMR